MFWRAMSASGPLSLVLVNETMSAARYISILSEHIVPFLDYQPLVENFVFQQDNAPSHKLQSTVAFLNANVVDVLPWPPYSPDLSPIENLWADIKGRVREQGVVSIEELVQQVFSIWTSPYIRMLCLSLANSMPRRIDMSIRNKGGYIKYEIWTLFYGSILFIFF